MRIKLEEFPGRVSGQYITMKQRLALGIWVRLINEMPKDTGWATFHTILSWNQRDLNQPGQPPTEEPNSFRARQPNTNRPTVPMRGYIQCRVPYARRLNEGWSTQAPRNFWENATNAEMSVLRSGTRRGPY